MDMKRNDGTSFWDATEVPTKNHESFQKFICSQMNDNSHPHEALHTATWHRAPNRKSSSSFGDQGTTASVNAYGKIIQFGTYLGVGRSGMFSVDHKYTHEPFLVYPRAKVRGELSLGKSRCSYGLHFPDLERAFDNAPQVKYVHYRWPRYEYKTKNKVELTIQWVVRNGIVLQQCVVTNLEDKKMDVSFEFAGFDSMRIRDLDYLDPSYEFNQESQYGGSYSDGEGPNGYSWVCAHELPSAGEQAKPERNFDLDISSYNKTNGALGPPNTGPKPEEITTEKGGSVAVVVSVFLNGNALHWSDRRLTWNETLKSRASGLATDDSTDSLSHTMEVVTAYKLICLPASKIDWRNFLIPSGWADVGGFLRKTVFPSFSLLTIDPPINQKAKGMNRTESPPTNTTKVKADNLQENPIGLPNLARNDHKTSSPKKHIEFVMRRHLEHILSVCSIPLVPPRLEEGDAQQSLSYSATIDAVALTCGDMSDHRVCTSASFFAFKFLVNVAARLNQMHNKDEYVSLLYERISTVCKGHLKWLEKAEKPASKCFVANYWPSGKMMAQSETSWQPQDSLTDTPFQLIKAALYANTFKEDRKFAQDAVKMIGRQWTKSLSKLDPRESCAWPRRQEADINLFRLDDHVWIWKALKSIESLSDNKKKSEDKFAPRYVQREILRRFKTTNDVLSKQMLAVTRSVRGNRFLFHARDTALFYGDEGGFFLNNTPLHDAWENTVAAQARLDDNQETGWSNALRYALAVVMGTRNHRVNEQQPAELVKFALSVLFRSASPNGFFPGRLDKLTKEPALISEESGRDSYFHASFEIPFIIMENSVKINAIYTGVGPGNSDRDYQRSRQGHLKENSETLTSQANQQEFANDSAYSPSPVVASRSWMKESVKKIAPLNSLIDPTTIVDIDEEWLYNYPPFLSNEEKLSINEFHKVVKALEKENKTAEHLVVQGTRLRSPKKLTGIASRTFVADTGTKQYDGEQLLHPFHQWNWKELWNELREPRTAEKAKKRYIWHPKANPEAALVCYICTPEVEKPAIFQFFDRHTNYENYFFEDTIMFLNTWETELHLSFYMLSDNIKMIPPTSPKSSERNGLHEAEEISRAVLGIAESEQKMISDELNVPAARLETHAKQRVWQSILLGSGQNTLLGSEESGITKASVGFRFSGDFFDRYWTCHAIGYAHDQVPMDTCDFIWPREITDRAGRQRRVLELHLFEKILMKAVESTQEIVKRVKSELGLHPGAFPFSILKNQVYLSSSAQWQKAQNILQAVEEKLEGAILAVSKWEIREKDRGLEKPRWTRKDERRYGVIVKKHLDSTNEKVREMRRLHASIKSLKETLRSSQDQVRNDLSLRSAEDVRFFTYVTVVFLPLGFASSIFSMNGSPAASLLTRMVICAAVALAITVLALVSAKRLVHAFTRVIRSAHRYSRSTMLNSLLIRQFQIRERTGSLKGSDRKTNSMRQRMTTKIISYGQFGFWVAYILVEFPARRVLLASRALGTGPRDWKQCMQVVIGVALLPFFIISWSFQVVIYNLADIFLLFWMCIIWPFSPSTSNQASSTPKKASSMPDQAIPTPYQDNESQESLESLESRDLWDRMHWLVRPPDVSRPIKILRDNYRERREEQKQDQKKERG